MERASVTRLYRDRSSHEAIMLLEATAGISARTFGDCWL